ncbi:DUF1697 domain-containing protein [Paraconexibacter algicola]|uniref:DUF1697 domain-containing protein n=1 Tax=Paraconexibacter algicola TaxID=2133960 RepID=A0A2T4UL13_9ACTN|nr:DUF1697 domain-containing protein [Paraconexibacter algicola]PTL59895.1 hypothetical protein C7Y72_09660 [Paraconexibacter algicola]
MPTHVALLRGINVGGVKVPMAELRAAAAECGHDEVATYIQSGNLVFTPGPGGTAAPAALATALRSALDARLGIDVPFVVRDRDAFAAELDANPFGEPQDGRLLHAMLRDGPVTDAELETIERARERARAAGSRDELALVGTTLYVSTPDGYGRSVLAQALTLGGRDGSPARNATARNWRTMTQLLAMLDGTA